MSHPKSRERLMASLAEAINENFRLREGLRQMNRGVYRLLNKVDAHKRRIKFLEGELRRAGRKVHKGNWSWELHDERFVFRLYLLGEDEGGLIGVVDKTKGWATVQHILTQHIDDELALEKECLEWIAKQVE